MLLYQLSHQTLQTFGWNLDYLTISQSRLSHNRLSYIFLRSHASLSLILVICSQSQRLFSWSSLIVDFIIFLHALGLKISIIFLKWHEVLIIIMMIDHLSILIFLFIWLQFNRILFLLWLQWLILFVINDLIVIFCNDFRWNFNLLNPSILT